MRNLEQTLNIINEKTVEMIKKSIRGLEIIDIILKKGEFDKSLYGESKLLEEDCDDLELVLDELIVETIARFQPAAGNLRYLVGVLQIVTDLERISDLNTGILKLIKRSVRDENMLNKTVLEILENMSAKVLKIFKTFELAFIEKKIENTYFVFGLDDEIDDLRDDCIKTVEELVKKDINFVSKASKVIVVAQKFERIADIIQNLSENYVYIRKGDVLKHQTMGE
ncbi:phosphate transport system protein [Hypnocyclicus thermotrophus]|uniref:Phosphate transport system protein n=1 Tax=Hypnocyclicus thermotrophus TaxID=1627895 RepID=A0AA46I641_9FUSO|nr:PhoU domain-containing protein [Hypnocyclicus thermotrophus]TDT70550.1 phosphate transport system protein [Hypnocyclicus thermotrophus]